MKPLDLQQWVMNKHPGRLAKKGLLIADKMAIVVAPGGGTKKSSLMRIKGIRQIVWLLRIDHVWICHTDSSRDEHIPSLEEARQIFTYPDGWMPADLQVQESFPDANTATQAKWFAEMLLQNPRVSHVAFSAAWYHNARWALTGTAAWQKVEDRRTIWFSVLPTEDPEPTENAAVNQSLEGELTRIAEYQETGDVATFEMARCYF